MPREAPPVSRQRRLKAVQQPANRQSERRSMNSGGRTAENSRECLLLHSRDWKGRIFMGSGA